MANGNGNVRLHKTMATTGSYPHGGGNFDCDSLSSVNGGHEHPDRGMSHTPLDDGSRAGPPHISRGGGSMPATAHSDHGPHHLPGGIPR